MQKHRRALAMKERVMKRPAAADNDPATAVMKRPSANLDPKPTGPVVEEEPLVQSTTAKDGPAVLKRPAMDGAAAKDGPAKKTRGQKKIHDSPLNAAGPTTEDGQQTRLIHPSASAAASASASASGAAAAAGGGGGLDDDSDLELVDVKLPEEGPPFQQPKKKTEMYITEYKHMQHILFQAALTNSSALVNEARCVPPREVRAYVSTSEQREMFIFQLKTKESGPEETLTQVSSAATNRCKGSAQICAFVLLALYNAGCAKADLQVIKTSGTLMGYIIGRNAS